ncbi:hypothetical protein MKW98_031482, partial [Papaver atlanticum]
IEISLQEAESLHLFQIHLLDYDSVFSSINVTVGVFHLASPCFAYTVDDPQRQLLDPAVKERMNVLREAKECGAKRVVLTSSISVIKPSPNWPADVPKREDCWDDLDYCKKNGLCYPASKIMAEKAAWDSINPGTVMGPIIPPTVNASMLMLIRLTQGGVQLFVSSVIY